MSKSTRIIKIFLALFLVVLLSCEGFAAVVSDNDGAAFITKAEFDSLKTNFQSQIDSYNTSIDNKIDSAIAGYLAGIKVDQKFNGDNYISRIGDVRFYTQAKTLNTSSVDDIRYGWMVRAFGSTTTDWESRLYFENSNIGSWLYSSDGNHLRSGNLVYGGTVDNYFYEVEDVEIDGTVYKALKDTTSKRIMHYFGAYGSCWSGASVSTLVGSITMEPYNLDLSSYYTNMVEPWSYPWSELGMNMTAEGQKFNIWSRSNNTTDDLSGYYYFNNQWNSPNIDINTFTTSAFTNFEVVKTFYGNEWYGQDTWFSHHNDTRGTNTVDGWDYYRVYTGIGGWHQGDIGYTNASGVDESWISYTKGTPWVKYRMPKFVAKKSGQLVNAAASKLLKTDIYPWSGVPLTKFKDKTVKLEVELKVETCLNDTDEVQTGKPYYVLIHKDKFPNNSTSYLLTSTLDDDYWVRYVDTGDENITLVLNQDVTSNWSKDDNLYLRIYVEDTSCYAKVKCSNIVFTTEAS